MFKEIKLKGKIIGLAALLIFLTCLVSFVGYRSYSIVVNSVETSDTATGLVRSLQEMRQQETDYIISKDAESADGVGNYMAAIKQEATRVRKDLSRDHREKMDTFLQRVDEYDAAFKEYVDIEAQKNEIQSRMKDGARDALSNIDGIRSDLSNQLNKTRTESDLLVDHRLAVFQDANAIIQSTLEARLLEIELKTTTDQAQFDQITGIFSGFWTLSTG